MLCHGEFLWASNGCTIHHGAPSPGTIIIPTYNLLQLWFATAHSIVVYIVPVFKKHSFFFFILIPPGMGYQQYDIAHPWQSNYTGNMFLVTAGAHESKSVCRLSVEMGWQLFPTVLKPFLTQSGGRGQSNPVLFQGPAPHLRKPLPEKHRTALLCGAVTDLCGTGRVQMDEELEMC